MIEADDVTRTSGAAAGDVPSGNVASDSGDGSLTPKLFMARTRKRHNSDSLGNWIFTALSKGILAAGIHRPPVE
eukprot:scaffold37919_cov35-Tisochrysis_lutea.AAC.3